MRFMFFFLVIWFFFANREIYLWYVGTKISHIQSMVAKRALRNWANVHTPMWKSRSKHSTAEFKSIQQRFLFPFITITKFGCYIWLDTMTLKPHISNIVSVSSFHIRNISRISRCLKLILCHNFSKMMYICNCIVHVHVSHNFVFAITVNCLYSCFFCFRALSTQQGGICARYKSLLLLILAPIGHRFMCRRKRRKFKMLTCGPDATPTENRNRRLFFGGGGRRGERGGGGGCKGKVQHLVFGKVYVLFQQLFI